MDALDNLELLAVTDRRIIRLDALGSGLSTPLPPGTPFSALASIAADETVAVARVLALSRVHLFCSCPPAAAAAVAAAVRAAGVQVASVVLERPSAAVPPSVRAERAPVCGTDGLTRGGTVALAAAAAAGGGAAAARESTAAFSGAPVLHVDGGTDGARGDGTERVTVESRETGVPHFDRVEELLAEVDRFYSSVEGEKNG
jgi:hypothetical protein